MTNAETGVLAPKFFCLPKMTTAVRNTIVGQKGMIIYDSTQSKLCFKKADAAAAASWELITSVQEA